MTDLAYGADLYDAGRECCTVFTILVLAYLIKHPDEVKSHDALVVPNHADGVKLRASQVLPS